MLAIQVLVLQSLLVSAIFDNVLSDHQLSEPGHAPHASRTFASKSGGSICTVTDALPTAGCQFMQQTTLV